MASQTAPTTMIRIGVAPGAQKEAAVDGAGRCEILDDIMHRSASIVSSSINRQDRAGPRMFATLQHTRAVLGQRRNAKEFDDDD